MSAKVCTRCTRSHGRRGGVAGGRSPPVTSVGGRRPLERPKKAFAFALETYLIAGRTMTIDLSYPGTLPLMIKRLLSGITSTTVRFCTVHLSTPM